MSPADRVSPAPTSDPPTTSGPDRLYTVPTPTCAAESTRSPSTSAPPVWTVACAVPSIVATPSCSSTFEAVSSKVIATLRVEEIGSPAKAESGAPVSSTIEVSNDPKPFRPQRLLQVDGLRPGRRDGDQRRRDTSR